MGGSGGAGILARAGLAVLVVVWVGGLGWWLGGSGGPGGAERSSPSVLSASASPRTAGLASALASGSARATPPGDGGGRAGLDAWASGGGARLLRALDGDLANVAESVTVADVGSTRVACLALSKDVVSAQALDPLPDDQGRAALAKLLADLGVGSADCVRGIDDSDAAALGRGAQRLAAGQADLRRLEARLSTPAR